MRCPKCEKTVSQKDRFCRHCGQVITPADIQTSRLREDERYHSLLSNRIVARCEPTSGEWGAHIYTGDSSGAYPRSRPRGCPEWVSQRDWHRWFHEGLVVWDNTAQSIGAISAAEAVQLIETVLDNDDWKLTGISVIEQSTVLYLPSSSPKRSKKKPSEPEAPIEERKPEIRKDERLRLRGGAAEEFKIFLRGHEALLRQMAADREKRAHEALANVYKMLLRSGNERDAQEIQLAGRAFAWQRQADNVFVADVPPDRVTIRLMENGFQWQPILERPGHFKWDIERFSRLEEALTWAETELPRQRREDEEAARKADEEQAADLARLAALDTLDLTPFWIDPATLEPERFFYRAYIELEYEPATSKKHEISFGEFWHFDKHYFTPAQLAGQLRLDPAQAEIQQLAPEFGWYRVYSRTVYPDAPAAAAQAQRLWDQSSILQHFAEKKVERARFGCQETETEYCVWLGWLEHKPQPYWTRQPSRSEYMNEQALGETLSIALDVNGYRKHFQIGYQWLQDEDLLWKPHNRRSQSKHAPAHLQRESQKWLQDHPR